MCRRYQELASWPGRVCALARCVVHAGCVCLGCCRCAAGGTLSTLDHSGGDSCGRESCCAACGCCDAMPNACSAQCAIAWGASPRCAEVRGLRLMCPCAVWGGAMYARVVLLRPAAHVPNERGAQRSAAHSHLPPVPFLSPPAPTALRRAAGAWVLTNTLHGAALPHLPSGWRAPARHCSVLYKERTPACLVTGRARPAGRSDLAGVCYSQCAGGRVHVKACYRLSRYPSKQYRVVWAWSYMGLVCITCIARAVCQAWLLFLGHSRVDQKQHIAVGAQGGDSPSPVSPAGASCMGQQVA